MLSTSSKSLVSVIMSAYNAEQFIGEAMKSVISQTYKEFELIIVNDGSTDKTRDVVEAFNDRRIVLISQENRGQDAALNIGLEAAKGRLIKFMDSDDLISPEMLELQVECLRENPDQIAYGEWDRFYDNRPDLARFEKLDYWKDMRPLDFLTARPEGVMLQCGIMLIPRQLIEKAGIWDERLILFNDTEFFTRVIIASKGVRFTPGARLYYRSGLTRSISAQRSRKFFESTFLATCLIGEQMLAEEDSSRVRTLVSTMFLDRYKNMYPAYSDLGQKHEQKISEYGLPIMKKDGGIVMRFLTKILGWKGAKIIQLICYKFGYFRILYPFKQIAKKKFGRTGRVEIITTEST
jgi:glycosyltransferase involved in cell wall biosynthesis